MIKTTLYTFAIYMDNNGTLKLNDHNNILEDTILISVYIEPAGKDLNRGNIDYFYTEVARLTV